MLKTQQLNQKTKKPKNKNQVLVFGFSENQKQQKKNIPNRPDPKPKTKILVLVFGFSENQKPKKQYYQTQQGKPKTKIWVLVFGFSENQKPKKTCPFWFWSGLLGLFFFLFFQKNINQNPHFGLVFGVGSDFFFFFAFGFWFGPWGLYLFVSWLLVFCRGGGHIYKFIFSQKDTAKTFSG